MVSKAKRRNDKQKTPSPPPRIDRFKEAGAKAKARAIQVIQDAQTQAITSLTTDSHYALAAWTFATGGRDSLVLPIPPGVPRDAEGYFCSAAGDLVDKIPGNTRPVYIFHGNRRAVLSRIAWADLFLAAVAGVAPVTRWKCKRLSG